MRGNQELIGIVEKAYEVAHILTDFEYEFILDIAHKTVVIDK